MEAGEDPLAAARREYAEEIGAPCAGDPVRLGEVRQRGGKVVTAFALEGDFDPALLASNRFSLEWPRGSGRFERFPEVDEARWFTLDQARTEILPSQRPLLECLSRLVRD